MGGPRLGEHTEAVLTEAGIEQSRIKQLIESGAAGKAADDA